MRGSRLHASCLHASIRLTPPGRGSLAADTTSRRARGGHCGKRQLIPQPLAASLGTTRTPRRRAACHRLCPACLSRGSGEEGACGPEGLETQLGAQGLEPVPGRTWALPSPEAPAWGTVPVVSTAPQGHWLQGPGRSQGPQVTCTRAATRGTCSPVLRVLAIGAGHALHLTLTQPEALPPDQLTRRLSGGRPLASRSAIGGRRP